MMPFYEHLVLKAHKNMVVWLFQKCMLDKCEFERVFNPLNGFTILNSAYQGIGGRLLSGLNIHTSE